MIKFHRWVWFIGLGIMVLFNGYLMKENSYNAVDMEQHIKVGNQVCIQVNSNNKGKSGMDKIKVLGDRADKINKEILDKIIGTGNKKVAYLTFDDGPSNNTLRILKVLDKYNIKGTFFIVGKNVKAYRNVVKKLYEDGQAIGNHTYSHNYKYIYRDKNNLIKDIEKADKELKEILGDGYNNKVFRFPGGSRKDREEFKKAVLELGYVYVDWNSLTGDAERKQVSVEKQYRRYIESSKKKNKLIILMHDMRGKEGVDIVLERIIKDLKAKGYEFRTIEYRR